MYIEFLIIYILLGVLIVLAITAIILLIAVLKKTGSKKPSVYQHVLQYQAGPHGGSGNDAFCKKCGSKFDAALNICPHCGTPR